MINLPHISTGTDDSGQAWVKVYDIELFDYVEDFLTEEHDLQYLWMIPCEESSKPDSYTMVFAGELMSNIETALSLLDAKKLHDIFAMNNPE